MAITDLPKKIYLNLGDLSELEDTPFQKLTDVTWCEDKIDESDVEYVLALAPTEGAWHDAYEAENKRVQRLEAILVRELGLEKARKAIAAPSPETHWTREMVAAVREDAARLHAKLQPGRLVDDEAPPPKPAVDAPGLWTLCKQLEEANAALSRQNQDLKRQLKAPAVDARFNLQDVFSELRKDFSAKDSGMALKAVERAMALTAKPAVDALTTGAVATLHDDGHYTFHGEKPHGYNYAGWRMDVYARPASEPKALTLTDEQKNAVQHAEKILRAVKLYDLAALLVENRSNDGRS